MRVVVEEPEVIELDSSFDLDVVTAPTTTYTIGNATSTTNKAAAAAVNKEEEEEAATAMLIVPPPPLEQEEYAYNDDIHNSTYDNTSYNNDNGAYGEDVDIDGDGMMRGVYTSDDWAEPIDDYEPAIEATATAIVDLAAFAEAKEEQEDNYHNSRGVDRNASSTSTSTAGIAHTTTVASDWLLADVAADKSRGTWTAVLVTKGECRYTYSYVVIAFIHQTIYLIYIANEFICLLLLMPMSVPAGLSKFGASKGSDPAYQVRALVVQGRVVKTEEEEEEGEGVVEEADGGDDDATEPVELAVSSDACEAFLGLSAGDYSAMASAAVSKQEARALKEQLCLRFEAFAGRFEIIRDPSTAQLTIACLVKPLRPL